MRKLLLSVCAAAAILAATALSPAQAMTPGTAAALAGRRSRSRRLAGGGLRLPASLLVQPPGMLVAPGIPLALVPPALSCPILSH